MSRKTKGFVLPIVITIILILVITGMAILTLAEQESILGAIEANKAKAFYQSRWKAVATALNSIIILLPVISHQPVYPEQFTRKSASRRIFWRPLSRTLFMQQTKAAAPGLSN